jgi:hypothetical protein
MSLRAIGALGSCLTPLRQSLHTCRMNTAHNDASTRAAEILAAVRDQFGIAFTGVGTGGGCMALEARLESGHWIVATDEGLFGFVDRIVRESGDELDDDTERQAYGWMVGIYPNNTEHGEDWWGGGGEPVVDVTDYSAFADALPELVGRALAELISTR